MKLTSRQLSFAAAAAFTAALWIASPAKAAEMDAPGKQTAVTASVRTAAAPVRHRHHYWPRYRVAAWYASHLRYADSAPEGWQSYYWRPRPVLLMVGIGF